MVSRHPAAVDTMGREDLGAEVSVRLLLWLRWWLLYGGGSRVKAPMEISRREAVVRCCGGMRGFWWQKL